MTAEIVNLRKARKAKARADKEQRAAENRAVHGRSKAEKARDMQAKVRIARELDGARRDGRPDGSSDADR